MKTIGFLCPAINDDYLVQLLRGAMSAAAERGLNFIAYVSQGQERFFDLVSNHRVDGLVVPTHYFTYSRRTSAQLREFLERYKPLPAVSLGVALPGVPSVIVDNATGLYEEIAHLITVHGFKRIAYFGGPEWNPEAVERRETYLKAMTDHGLPIDDSLIFQRHWGHRDGESLVSEMLDQRKVFPQAIVASNDQTAIDSMEALAAHGIKVPSEIAIVGFDDTLDARYLRRPLTTVRQPIFELGAASAHLLARILDGESNLPELTKLGTIFLVRQSCGCLPIDVKDAVTSLQLKQAAPAKLESARPLVIRDATTLFDLKPDDRILKSVDELFDAFRLNLETETTHVFINSLDDLIRDDAAGDRDHLIWQALISIMRRNVLPLISERETALKAENLFHQGRIIVAGTSALSVIHRTRKNESFFWNLANNDALAGNIEDVAHFANAMNSTVKRVPITRCYLGLTPCNELNSEAELLFEYDVVEKKELSARRQKFSTQDLAPAAMSGRFALIVQPMISRSGLIGFLAIEMNQLFPQVLIDIWRQANATLNGLLMYQEIREKNYKLESEIKAREEIEKELQFRAFHDALTRLPNRALFLDRLSQAEATSKRRSDFAYAVLFVDLDGFKKHNDTHGHEAGDELLIAVAERLRRCVRSVDTLARMGGDEFTILLSDLTHPEGAEQVARRVLDELNAPFELKHGDGSISASIGIALSDQGPTADRILQNADVAMYRAKNAGKSRYVLFSDTLLT